MNDKLIETTCLSHSFETTEVLKEIDLRIGAGEFIALVGPSGCGKTTLLNLLSGFYLPRSGSVMRRGRIRMIHQAEGLFPWLTVEQNIRMGLQRIKDRAAQTREIDDLIGLVNLHGFAAHYPHQLSGGMRQRAELARALAGDSDILLMDEPFSSLDYQARLLMRRLLVRVLETRPRTVVFITHDIEEAAQLADRILVLSDRPARICDEIHLSEDRPRDPTDFFVVDAVRRILSRLGLSQVAQIECTKRLSGYEPAGARV